MSEFARWLKRRATGVEALGYAALGAVLALVWAVPMFLVLAKLVGTEPNSAMSKYADDPRFAVLFFAIMFCLSPLIAFSEEFIFRAGFYELFIKFYRHPDDIIWAVVGNILVFGLPHLLITGFVQAVLVQGVGGGVLFSLVYLKTGGFQRKPWRGMFWSAVTHTLYNSLIFGVGLIAAIQQLHH